MDTRTATSVQESARQKTVWLTTEEVMAHLRIGSKHTLRKYRALGLPMHDLGGMHLFDLDEVDVWVRSRCSDLTPGRTDREAAA